MYQGGEGGGPLRVQGHAPRALVGQGGGQGDLTQRRLSADHGEPGPQVFPRPAGRQAPGHRGQGAERGDGTQRVGPLDELLPYPGLQGVESRTLPQTGQQGTGAPSVAETDGLPDSVPAEEGQQPLSFLSVERAVVPGQEGVGRA